MECIRIMDWVFLDYGICLAGNVSVPLDPHRIADQGDGRGHLGWGDMMI